MTLTFLPALAFMFFMGFLFYWLGDQKKTYKKKPIEHEHQPCNDGVTILPMVAEENVMSQPGSLTCNR